MTKWAVTADLQLQTQPRYATISEEGVSSRLEDTLECLRWIVREALARACTGLIVIGDLFDSRTLIDVSVIDRACRVFAEIAEQLTIEVMVGNHDCYLRTARLNSMQMLRGTATVREKVSRSGPLVFAPWIDSPELYRKRLDKAAKLGGDFLFAHAMFEGAVPMAKGLPIEWLRGRDWKGVYLGDVHDPVVLQVRPPIRYVGSPLQIHFGDAGGVRGFIVLDDSTGAAEFIENTVSPRFHVLVSESDDPKAVTDRDFFRVKAPDEETSLLLANRAKAKSAWVECEAVATKAASYRLPLRATMPDGELVDVYCAHVGVTDEATKQLGCDLLEEARSS